MHSMRSSFSIKFSSKEFNIIYTLNFFPTFLHVHDSPNEFITIIISYLSFESGARSRSIFNSVCSTRGEDPRDEERAMWVTRGDNDETREPTINLASPRKVEIEEPFHGEESLLR